MPSSSTASAPRPATEIDTAAQVAVRNWNEALDRHDLEKLERLYGDEVYFYGLKRSKAQVMQAKRAALAKQPRFRQEIIGPIDFQKPLDDTVNANFTKKSGTGDKLLVIAAKLVLNRRGNDWVIVEESDEKSLREQDATPEGCEPKVTEVVHALPEVARALKEAADEVDKSDGGASLGGFGPQPDGYGGFSVVTGVFMDDRLDSRVAYDVDRQGHLKVLVRYEAVTPPEAALRAVEQACRH